MNTAYEWKTKGIYKTNAEVAGKVFKELEETVGLTAHNLVEASRQEDAPLHNEFEWNDEVAGEKWREQQGRVMISNLTIRISDAPDAEPIKAYFTFQRKTEYHDVRTILVDPELTNSLFETAMKELHCFQQKYRQIEAFASLFAEIRNLDNLAS